MAQKCKTKIYRVKKAAYIIINHLFGNWKRAHIWPVESHIFCAVLVSTEYMRVCVSLIWWMNWILFVYMFHKQKRNKTADRSHHILYLNAYSMCILSRHQTCFLFSIQMCDEHCMNICSFITPTDLQFHRINLSIHLHVSPFSTEAHFLNIIGLFIAMMIVWSKHYGLFVHTEHKRS